MINGWLIYGKQDAEKNNRFIELLQASAKEFGILLQLQFVEELSYGVKDGKLFIEDLRQKMPLPDFVIIRSIAPLLSKQFELLNIPCFNQSFVAEICNHKARTHQFLATKHIPMIDTLFIKRSDLNVHTLPFDYPIVVKESHGRGGKEVYAVSTADELKTLLDSLTEEELIIQKMLVQPKGDVRVFVVGKTIVAAILRSNEHSFKANYSLGGRAEYYELSKQQRKLVETIIELFNEKLAFVGIDFLISDDGRFLFNEIEDVVGSRTLYANSTINIADLYMKHIIDFLTEKSKEDI